MSYSESSPVRAKFVREFICIDGTRILKGEVVNLPGDVFRKCLDRGLVIPDGIHYQDNLLPEYKRSPRRR